MRAAEKAKYAQR